MGLNSGKTTIRKINLEVDLVKAINVYQKSNAKSDDEFVWG
jgi:hypothetical protein